MSDSSNPPLNSDRPHPSWLDTVYDACRDCVPGAIPSEVVPIEDTCTRVAAQDVRAPGPVPRISYAMRQGHAVRAADTAGATSTKPIDLAWICGLPSLVALRTDPAARALSPGESEFLLAGVALPGNTDAILPNTEEPTDEVMPPPVEHLRVTAPLCPGANVWSRGEDYARGAMLATRGTRITPQLQAVLTAAGVLSVPVHRRPRVGVILSSYDAVPAANVEHAWQRPDSTSAYVRATLARWGYMTPPVEQLAPDDPTTPPSARHDEHEAYFQRLHELMSRYDLLIGVGMPTDSAFLSDGVGGPLSFPLGRRCIQFDETHDRRFTLTSGDDRTPPVRGKRPIYRPESFNGIGGWEGFAFYDRAFVLNLPGHTPEIAAIMHLFVRRMLDLMEGVGQPVPIWRKGALANPITRHPSAHRFLWGTAHLDDGARVSLHVSDEQDRLHLRAFATSNALVAIQSGTGRAAAGESVDYLSLD